MLASQTASDNLRRPPHHRGHPALAKARQGFAAFCFGKGFCSLVPENIKHKATQVETHQQLVMHVYMSNWIHIYIYTDIHMLVVVCWLNYLYLVAVAEP